MWLAQSALARHSSGTRTPEGKMEFRSAADDFLRFCAVERQLSDNTLQAYAYDLADLRRWLPAGVLVSEISTDTLKGYLEQVVGERKLAAASIRRRFARPRHFSSKPAWTSGSSSGCLGIRASRRRKFTRMCLTKRCGRALRRRMCWAG
jgi:integrase/recombinase XerD